MSACNATQTPQTPDVPLNLVHYILIVLSLTVLAFIVLGTIWLKKYRSLVHTIQDLQGKRSVVNVVARQDSPVVSPTPVLLQEALDKEVNLEQTPLQQGYKARPPSRSLWRPMQQGPHFTRSDLSLLQLIKAGKEGVFYQARMTKGTCKGHTMFTCKMTKEGVRPKQVDMEVSIMRKLSDHKNILQLLDWNTTEDPCMLIMEFVSYGTLRSFLQTNRVSLSTDPNLQSLLTITSYHIALAMEHLRSKMVVHCDLALRNIMVSKFPWEVKVTEFGMARDLTRTASRRSSRWKNPRQRVPLRWYPPEYFRNNYYSFKGDVWAFGILLWEMQTFGTLPYPDLDTSEAVVYQVCAGYRNSNPDGCRPEILDIIHDCWLEPYTLRPSFTDIVQVLEDTLENDADYVEVEIPEETEKHETNCLSTSERDDF
ncbi:tyrosine kinase receptor Cad96Ca [Polymixia lowei]